MIGLGHVATAKMDDEKSWGIPKFGATKREYRACKEGVNVSNKRY